jgi:quercetin dioxygenase-like cupin family protein
MSATATIQVENDRVIVTEWCFAPGAETGYHVHAHDYVVVPLTTGNSYARPTGIAHNVINVNEFEFRFIEIELK